MDDESATRNVRRNSRGKRDRGRFTEGDVLGVGGDDNGISAFDVMKKPKLYCPYMTWLELDI